jgi:Carboxypeptidase regulatory-like domain
MFASRILIWTLGALLVQQTVPGTRDQRAGGPPPAPTGTGVIAGTVVSSDAGRSVRRAQVNISGGGMGRTVLTDDRGNFSFDQLPPGDFTLSASKGGYLDTTYGQTQPGNGRPGTTIHLIAGQRVERLSMPLARGGVITGTVRDESGEPAYATQVRAFKYSMRSGERTLQQVGNATTDDRGVYRIPLLQSGDYIVMATPRDEGPAAAVVEMMKKVEEAAVAAQRTGATATIEDAKIALSRMSAAAASTPTDPAPAYAPVYYPGTTRPSNATSVAVTIGEERNNVDVQLQLVPTAAISGTLIGPDGTVPPGAQVLLADTEALPGMPVRTVRPGADGKFSFNGIAPGQYIVSARVRAAAVSMEVPVMPPGMTGQAADNMKAVMVEKAMTAAAASAGASADALWGQTEITTDGRPLTNVTVSLQRGMTVTGSVVFEGVAGMPPEATRLTVTLVPTGRSLTGDNSATPPVLVDSTGKFTVRGVMPGTYRVVSSSGVPPTYQLKSSVWGDRDTLDLPMDLKPGEDRAGGVLTFSTKTAEISGTLQDGSGQPASSYTVIAFAADTKYWTPNSRRIQAARPGTDGRFSVRSLPPGDYRLATVTDVEPGQWFDPAFLRQLVGASVPVTLADGEKKIQPLRINR